MSEKGKRRSKYVRTAAGNEPKYLFRCLWCDKPTAAARPDAKTCCPAHRNRLARYVAKHGHAPLFPFGLGSNQADDQAEGNDQRKERPRKGR